MVVRDMNEGDISAVARLLAALAREYIVHECAPEAVSTFLRDNDEAALRRLAGQGYVYHVAEADGEIAGFIGVRERRHLYHLFVAKHWQGRGIARTLWDHGRRVACESGGDGGFTVNSSNHAVGVYRAFGFAPTAPRQCVNGLPFNPMALSTSMSALVGSAQPQAAGPAG